jgi:hypothetical protein
MPWSYVIDSANRLARVAMAGTIRGADIAAAMQTIYADPAWQPGFDSLWECTGITELLFERDDLPTLVGLQRESRARSGYGREAIVVSRALDDVMAKMYAAMMRESTREVLVCRSLAEAAQFLGRPVQ